MVQISTENLFNFDVRAVTDLKQNTVTIDAGHWAFIVAQIVKSIIIILFNFKYSKLIPSSSFFLET